MNLHQVVSGAIGAVNPFVEAQILKYAGEIKAPDFSILPTFYYPIVMMVQKQAIIQADLQHVEGLNIQGKLTAIYTNGNWCGVDRKNQQGGDVFIIGNDRWRVLAVPEIWPDWTKVIACQQL